MQAPPTLTDSDTRRQARRGLAIFIAIVVVFSAPIEAGIILTNAFDGGLISQFAWLTGLMLVPAIASVVARLVLREGFSDVSFRLGGSRGRKAVVQALIFPVTVGLLAYGIARISDLAQFGGPSASGGWGRWVVLFTVMLILVSGDEIGWRGYMLTRLIDSRVPRPILASVLIWGLWHVPLFLWGGFVEGASPLLSTALLMVTTTSLGHVLARTRLETGSVWPAIVLHVAWNDIIQTGFHPLTMGSGKQL